MRIFKSNTTKIVIACFIIFMAIPFIFVESPETQKNKSVSIPLEQSSNPLTRFLDRIGSFYGLKKGSRVSDSGSSSLGNGSVNLASAKKSGRQIPPGNLTRTNGQDNLQNGADAKTGIVPGTANHKAKLPEIKEYIRMDGETYEVIKDNEGRKFVSMPDGFVPYEKLMSDTVSQQEFEEAKAQAPQLEDWEIFEALRTPGGLPAYLAQGGSGKDHSSKYGNKEGTRVFGKQANGTGGDNDDMYDERKLAQSIQSNQSALNSSKGGSNSALTSSLRDKYKDANKNNGSDNNSNTENLSSLIGNSGVVMGTGTVNLLQNSNKNEDNNSGRSYFESKEAKVVETITETINPADESVNNYMANKMGVEIPDKKDVNGNVLKNAWIYPQGMKTETPGTEFYNRNSDIFSKGNTNGIKEAFAQSDKVYNKNKEEISYLKESMPNLKIAVVDGIEDGQVKSVGKETFHYQIVEGLTGGKSLPGEYINIKPEEKGETLVVVSDEKISGRLKDAGYNVALFNKFAITPGDTENFYQETISVVKNMVETKKLNEVKAAQKAKSSSVLANDVVNAKVGVRGT